MSNEPNYERMFNAAIHALADISLALSTDPEDGGSAPILEAIAILRQQVEQLSASNARMAEAAKNALDAAGVDFNEHSGGSAESECPICDFFSLISSPESSAWLAEHDAEVRRKALEELNVEILNMTLIPGTAVQQIMAVIESRIASKNG